jgi:predicted secreted hydrolase
MLIAAAAWRLWPSGAGPGIAALDPAVLAGALPAADGAPTGDDWTLELPRDLGPHPDTRAEVWDLTGQLRGAGDERFGFRLTLVRLGLTAPGAAERPSRLAADALLLGRVELIPTAGEPLTARRASRMTAGLAGADGARVWLEDWELSLGDTGRLRVAVDGAGLDLALTPIKPALRPGPALLGGGAPAGGRGPDAGAGLRWFAEPRLRVEGRLLRDGRALAVSGSAWLDRVWGDVAGVAGLAGTQGQLALNRFMLQLDDASELLCIQLRRRTGGGTPIPTCVAIAADGTTQVLKRRDLTLTPGGAIWRAPGGAAYPVAWRLAAHPLGLDLAIDALHPAQEATLGEQRWSGAVGVRGRRDGAPIDGGGRMDLSGYDAVGGS